MIPRAVHIVVSAEQEILLQSKYGDDPEGAMNQIFAWANEQERWGAPRPEGGWDWNAWIDLWRCLCGEYVWGEEPAPWNYLYENHDVWVAYTPPRAVGVLEKQLDRVDKEWFAERHRTVPITQARQLEGDYHPVSLEKAWACKVYAGNFFRWAAASGGGVWLVTDITVYNETRADT